MADTTKTIKVELTAESAKFEKAFDGAGKAVDGLAKKWTEADQRAEMAMRGMHEQALKLNTSMGGLGAKLGESFKSLAGGGGISGALGALGPAGIAAAAGVGAVTVAAGFAVKSMANLAGQAEQWTNQATTTGLGVEAVQQLRAMLEDAGIGSDALTAAMKGLHAEIASGGESLKKFGIDLSSIKDLAPEEQLQAVAQSIMNISDVNERGAAAVAAFGKAGEALIPVLGTIAESGYKAFAALGPEATKALVHTDDELDKAARSWTEFKNAALGGLAKVIVALDEFDNRTTGKIAKPVTESLADFNKRIARITADVGGDLSLGPQTEAQKAAVAAFQEGERKKQEALRKSKEEAERAAAAFKALVDQLSGTKAQEDLDQLTLAFNKLGVGGVADLEALRKKLEQLQQQGAKITDKGLLGVLKGGKLEVPKLLEGLDLGDLPEMGAEVTSSLQPSVQMFKDIALAASKAGMSTSEIKDALDAAGASAGEVRVALGENTDATYDWADALQQLANLSEIFGEDFGRIGGAVAGVGASLEQLGKLGVKNFGDLGKSMKTFEGKMAVGAAVGQGLSAIGGALGGQKSTAGRAFGGAAMGAQIGAIAGPWGMAAGAVAGAIFGALHKPGWVKQAEAVGKKWGVTISDALAKQIDKDAKRLGDAVSAQLVNLPAIIQEAGGLEKFGVDKALGALDELFAKVKEGKIDIAEAGEVFDSVFSQMLPKAIDKTTGLASKAFTDLIAKAKAAGIESQAMSQFLAEQTTKLGTALEAVAKGGVITAKSAAGVGAAVVAEFEQLRASGMSAKDALDQIQPTIDALREKLATAGVSGGAAFDQLAAESALLHDEVGGPLMEAILGAGDAIVALANSGALTQESFGGLTAAISDTYAKLQAEGKSGPQALALMQPSLQAIWEAEQRFGYAADAGTQALIDQAVAAGEVGAAHQSAAERMVDATQRVADILEAVAKKMGVEIPEAAKAGAQGVQDAFDGVSVDIPINYTPSGVPGVPGIPPEVSSFQAGTNGFVNFGDETLALLHGWEAVVPKEAGGYTGLGGDTFIISPSFNDNPLQTFEGVKRQREFTLRTLQRETSRNLATAVASGRA